MIGAINFIVPFNPRIGHLRSEIKYFWTVKSLLRAMHKR
jgi:hypothetical protein